jgi:SAM-dependent methyltransferase
VKRFRDVLDSPVVYRLWQAPFAAQKLRPVIESGDIEISGSVLDVGCGPGTNVKAFGRVQRYLGIDLNEAYVDFAQRRYEREFRVADVTEGIEGGEQFDLVLMNSLMHHIDDQGASVLLDSLQGVVAPGGVVHVLDLVLPPDGVARAMAQADRGEFPRTPEGWKALIASSAQIAHSCLYDVGVGPVGLWRMIHLQLRLAA